jgi:Family of unknown function (DUF6717)
MTRCIADTQLAPHQMLLNRRATRTAMSEPLFPIKAPFAAPRGGILIVDPYRFQDAWVFDDAVTGLQKEPFVSGVTEMIDRLVAGIPDAEGGFRLLFSAAPFEGAQTSLTWVRADPVEGNWYRADDTGDEGWLCPALLCYFPMPPPKIYVRAESRENGPS